MTGHYWSGMFSKWILVGLLALNLQTGFSQEGLIRDEVVQSQTAGRRPHHSCVSPGFLPKDSQRRYPVLYVQDGQNSFSTAGTNCAFGWGSWQLDKTADALARAGKMQEIIMVAVDNSSTRGGRIWRSSSRSRLGDKFRL